MAELLAKLLVAYLLGGVMGGDLMRRLSGGEDLRTQGSGNVGATNALRSKGWKFALPVLLIDIGKGVAAALLVPAIAWPWAQSDALPRGTLSEACGFAAALGHCYPVLAGFRGGKGVATLTGVFGALLPAALPWMILAFAVTVLLSGYVSLASLSGAAVALAYAGCFTASGLWSTHGAFAAAMVTLMVFKHRENIARLLAGTEARFDQARVLGRQLDRWFAR